MIEAPTKTLEDVAKFFEKHGWIQKRSFDGKDGYCLAAAFDALAGFDWIGGFSPDYDEDIYTQLFNQFKNKTGYEAVVFNDDVAKSKEDIIAALRS